MLRMLEEPIASRAEQYPKSDRDDVAQGVVRAALDAIPFVGGPITELLTLVLSPAVQRRRDEWFKDLADAVEQLEKTVEGFRIENLAKNESFVSATIQATRIALATHHQEKRGMLRNALLNIALGKAAPNEDLQQVYLTAIEAFTPSHVKVLNFLWKGSRSLQAPITNYGQAIESALPELRGQSNFLQYIMNDLRNRGFSNLSGPSAAHPQNPAITNLGIQFLTFIAAPQE